MSQPPALPQRPRTVKLAVRRRRSPWGFGAAAAAIAFVAAGWGVAAAQFPGQVRDALKEELSRDGAPASVVQFYARRGYTPLWISGPGLHPLRLNGAIAAEGRQVEALTIPDLARPRVALLAQAVSGARSGRPADLARAEVALSLRLADYVARTWPQRPSTNVAFIDPELKVPNGAEAVLTRAAAEASLSRYVAAVAEVNPVYRRLQAGLAAYRAQWSRLPQVQVPVGSTLQAGAEGERVRVLRVRLGLPPGAVFDPALGAAVAKFQSAHGLPPTGRADAATLEALNAGAARYEGQILSNLARARALPPTTADRFILVNVPAAELQYFEGGAMRGHMPVAVGTAESPTPVMAGLLRYLVFNPFWNIPVDLVSGSVAPKVLARGPDYFRKAHLQALSNWDDDTGEISPESVDWRAVARGQELRVRQWPGGDNMMGKVKFMLPNELGIYLHDTPDKAVFSRSDRLISAGCVRLERAPELAEWLLGDRRPTVSPAPDQQVDLQEPTPVYIAYLTAAPGPQGLQFYPDVYARSHSVAAAPQPQAPRASTRGVEDASASF